MRFYGPENVFLENITEKAKPALILKFKLRRASYTNLFIKLGQKLKLVS